MIMPIDSGYFETNNEISMDDVAASLVNLYADYASLNGNTNDEYAKAVAIAIRMLTD